MVSANKGMKILNQQKELQLKYWDGAVNFLCRLWFYFIRGLEIFDKFKYFFIVFGGLYYLIGKKHLFLMVAVSVVAVPVIMVMGFFTVHKLGGVLDYLNTKFSTYSANKQIELLEEIRDLLNERKN